MPNTEELNELKIEDIHPVTNIWDILTNTIDNYPLLSYFVFASIIYIILNDIYQYKKKK